MGHDEVPEDARRRVADQEWTFPRERGLP